MNFASFKEQFKTVILEYLSPEAYEARLGNSADMVTRDQANSRYLANAVRQGAKDHPRRKIVQNQSPIKGRWQAIKQIDDLSKTRSDRVSKVKQGRRGGGNSKLQRKGFDDNRAVGPNKPRPATLKLGKTLDIEEQFRNAILNYLNEGPRTGNSPTQTMAMGGRFMRRLKKSVDSGETGQDVLDSKKAQANRINRKVADRQAKYATSHGYDPESVERVRTQSKRRGSDSYYKGQGNPHKIPGLDDPSMERAPANAPNPTDVQRRAKGQEAYPRRTMQAREQFKNVILEYLSPEAYASRTQQSADIARRQAPKRAEAISKKFDKSSGAGYFLGAGGGLDHTGYEDDLPDRISKLSSKRKERVAKVEKGRRTGAGPLGKPTKLSKRGFDDQDMPNRPAKTRKPSYDGGHRVRVGDPGESSTASYGTARNLSKVLKGDIEIDK